MENILSSLGYKLNERKLGDLRALFSEDYRALDFLDLEDTVVYYGLEHSRMPKLPNITVLSNLKTSKGNVFGSTMGHQHVEYLRGDSRLAQEIYEFQGDGAMLLRANGVAKLHILEKGEKVIVSPRENMTIFNLGEQDLTLLDYANPIRNAANKDLEKKIGPLLLMRSEGTQVVCKINSAYFQSYLVGSRDAGLVRFDLAKSGSIKQAFNEHTEVFAEEGIDLVIGGNLPRDYKRLGQPLLNLVLDKDPSLVDLIGA